MDILEKNRYFDLFHVGEHSYAAIISDQIAMSNAGFIDLGDKTIVFDTFLSREAAEELKKCAEKITGKKAVFVINSHSHLDHTVGNFLFENEATIISSPESRDLILADSASVKFGSGESIRELKELEGKLPFLTDNDEILDTQNSIFFLKNITDGKNRIVPPTLTFEGKLSLIGFSAELELLNMGKVHSPGDVIGICKEDKTVFSGDLLFIDRHPYMGAGDPIRWIEILSDLVKKDIEYFIPGHGNICSKDKVMEQIDYMKQIMSLVKHFPGNASEIGLSDMDPKFHHYTGASFRWNINFLSNYFKTGN